MKTAVLVGILLIAPPCLAQDVSVRVVSAADGHPLPKVPVFVRHMATAQHDLRLETDRKGEARFVLPDSAPPYIRVDVSVSRTRWECGCFAEGYTADVMQKGVVEAPAVRGKPHTAAGALTAAPGEILIALRPLSFFEGLYMFFVGQ